MKLKIEYLKPTELKTYAGNAKTHPEKQIEQIKESIKQFGMNDPIAIWKDNEIIEGHGRLQACLELGLDKVPVIRLDELTDEQRRAYGLAHNKLTMNSGFDTDLLNIELDGITEIDMSDFGFDLTLPEPFDNDIMSEYDEHAKEFLKYDRIIITYTSDQYEQVREFLGIQENEQMKVVYDIDEVIRRRDGIQDSDTDLSEEQEAEDFTVS